MGNKYNTIPLVVAFTPNYFVPAATCLYSVLKNSTEQDNFHVICLLSEELPNRLKEKIQKLAEHRAEFSFVNLKGALGDVYVDERYTEAASYRLLLPKILPDYDKILYIDCDMVIRQNLAKLYRETDLGDNYLGGVFEASLDFQKKHLDAVGCKPGEYINSGFLLMNLKLLRDDNLVEKLINALNVDYLEFPDQDAINIVCKGRILGLPPYYNSIRTFYLPQYDKFFLQYYSKEDLNKVRKEGNIHYTGGKPWNCFSVEFRTWWDYYSELPEWIKDEWVENKKMKNLYKVYKMPVIGNLINIVIDLYRKIKTI